MDSNSHARLQMIFNAAVEGLRAQGFERSLNAKGQCQYRGKNGRKCALGFSIRDADYTDALDESTAWAEGRPDNLSPRANAWYDEIAAAGFYPGPQRVAYALVWGGLSLTQMGLGQLQDCHDNAGSPEEMEQSLRSFARDYDLYFPTAEDRIRADEKLAELKAENEGYFPPEGDDDAED